MSEQHHQTGREPLDPGSPAASIVDDERELLARVREALDRRAPRGGVQEPNAYDAELVELRDALAEAKPEDIPPLVEQMARVQALAASRRRDEKLPVDPQTPYFAHLRLREPTSGEIAHGRARGDRVRDVLIGRRAFIDREARVQIVDWRDAPVSQIYYRYDEGDDYDEVVDERHLEGVVEARRNVTIHGGALRRVSCPQGVFVVDPQGRWFAAHGGTLPTLQGGQGKAARPPRPTGPRPRSPHARRTLGVHGGEVPRADKHLPEIAALIDPVQFDLITAPSSGLVVIQGGAGSGKTTVALHRVAYLVFHDPRRFRPSRCLVVVPSVALERYVQGVLPALGVRGVPVTTYRSWARGMRRKVLPALGDRYTDETPSVVARLKKHPGMLPALDRFIADEARAALSELAEAAHTPSARAAVSWQWESLRDQPPLTRLQSMGRWLGEGRIDAAARQRVELGLGRARRRLRDVRTLWGERLTDGQRLRAALPSEGSEAVGDREIDELVRWVAAQLDESAAEELAGLDPEASVPVDGGALDDTDRGRAGGRWDREDDALLLRLTQLLRGGLFKDTGGLVEYDHIAIDEAQDLSPVEIKVLVSAAATHEEQAGGSPSGDGAPNPSVTLAGDVAQRVVFDNAFHGWHELLADIGYARVEIRELQLSYRSTEEVMRFARQVLAPGELQPGEEAITARTGAPVELHRFDAMGEAIGFLADALRSLAGREPTASVALIARYPGTADAYHDALARAEVPSLRRVRRQDFAFAPGIDVTDVSQVKGLEFDYVVLLDVTAANYPDTVEARHLLHIGATRAAHQLWLLSPGPPSSLVPEELLAEALI